MKKVVALILSVVFVFSLSATCFAQEGTVITNVNEAYNLVHSTELVDIYDATLYVGGTEAVDVYYVVCRGLDFTEFDPSQPRSYASAIKIGLSSENNAYIKKLKQIVFEKIPAGSKVVFVGHSMGGMVIQQAIANKEVKNAYEILYTLSIGSPYILTKSTKEGTLVRVVDSRDPVPFMSIPLLANPYVGTVRIERSGEAPLIHFTSYEKGKCWNSYDCLGNKNGGSYIVLRGLVG